jgi:trimeric autotransporter adhesin
MRFQQTLLGGREVPAFLRPFTCVVAVACSILCAGSQSAWASPTITTTTLAVTSAGNAVTTVTPGSVVLLTATVTVSSTPVAPGQVNFCDATAKSCTDIHLLGTAQLTSTGAATLKFRPGVGNHSYKAVFLGTTSNAPSASATSALAVVKNTGLYPTATTAGTGLQGVIPDLFSSTVKVRGRGTAPPTGTVSILDTSNTNFVLGTATLTPGPPGLSFLPSLIAVEAPQLIASGDFNGDGISDLAVVGRDLVYLGNGDGTFMAGPATFPTTATGGTPSSVVVGDFNGDGKADLALLDGGVTILLGNGDGTFVTVANPPQVQGVEVATIGDFNGDGNADLAVTDPTSNTVTILFGSGDGTFVTGPSTATGDGPSSVAAGDFNGDGKVDLAITNQVSNTVTILLGNGDGTFTSAASPATGSGSASIVVGDLNGDGKADLAVTNSTSNTLTILIGNGDGTFTPATSPATDRGSSVVALGDFNGDGTPDLAVAGVNGDAAILVGNGDGTFAAAAGQDSASGGQSIAIGDFDGDGLSDLAAAIFVDDGDTVAVLLAETEWATATAYDLSPQGQGTHLIAASYSGDSNYNGSTSATQAVTVNPGFNITASTISSISPGASGTSTLTVTPSDGFTGTVTLSCSVGNQPPTCSITPSTLAISGTAPVTGLLTINTQATTNVGTYTIGVEIATLVNNVAISFQTLGLPFSVGTNPPSGFALTSSAISIASPEANGTSTITVTPSGGFMGTVRLGCDVIVSPANTVFPATCSVPPSLAVSGTAPVTTTLTVATQATASAGAYQVEVFASGAPADLNEDLIVPVMVNAVPAFALSNTAVSIALPGATGTSTITIAPSGGFTGNVALSCTVTGPAGATDPRPVWFPPRRRSPAPGR